jgi:ribosome-associated toxin RatA of RatAB toxin-antitoxin module
LLLKGGDFSSLKNYLSLGEIIVVENEKKNGREFVQAIVLVNAPAERVYDVITDFEKYPDVFSDVKRVEIIDKTPDTITARFHLKSDLAIIPVKISYTIKYYLKKNEVTWDYIEGDLAYSEGFWKLYPEGDKTIVIYRLSFDIKPPNFFVKAVYEFITKNRPVLATAALTSAVLVTVRAIKLKAETGAGFQKRERNYEF